MERYYAILARSLAGDGDRAEARRALYERVRGQIDRLIETAEPPMPASRAIAEKSALEQAIARMEAEYARREPPAAPPRRPAPVGPAGPAHAPRPAPQREPATPAATGPRGPAARPPGARPPAAPLPSARSPAARPPSRHTGPAPARPRRRRVLGIILAGVAVLLAGAAAAGWYALSAVYAPESPDMSLVARRLENSGSATLFVGAAVDRVASSPDAVVSASRELFGQGAVRILARNDTARPFGRIDVAQIELTPAIRRVLAGKTLRVTIVARAARGNASRQMALAISDGGRRTTGWKRLPLDGHYRPYTIEYSFEPGVGRRSPVIAVWADTQGAGRGIEISEVSLRVVPNPPAAAAPPQPAPAAHPEAGPDPADSPDEGE